MIRWVWRLEMERGGGGFVHEASCMMIVSESSAGVVDEYGGNH